MCRLLAKLLHGGKNMPRREYFLLDCELSTPEEDMLCHSHYADTLLELIQQHSPPFNLMLSGSWGQGKSTIVNLLMDKLKDKPGIHCKKISAWRYEGASARRAFLRDLWKQIGGEERTYEERVRSVVAGENEDKGRKTSVILCDTLRQALRWVIVLGILAFAVCAIQLASALVSTGKLGIALVKALKITPGVLSAIVVAAVTGPVMTSLSGKLGLRNWSIVLPALTADQFEDMFRGQLDTFASDYEKEHKTPLSKLVIIVDDIDRLDTDEVTEVLGSLKAFIESNKRCIFLVPCAEETIERAFDSKGPKDTEPGQGFLDKLFQFRVRIAPTMSRDMVDYAKAVVRQEVPQLACRLGDKFDDVIEILVGDEAETPRQVKKMINAFAAKLSIAESREAPGGKIGDSTISTHLDFLAVITVLEERYQPFFKDLLKHQGLVEALLHAYQGRVYRVPEYLRPLLSQYGKLEGDDGWSVAEEHQNLLGFLMGHSHRLVGDDLGVFLFLGRDSFGQQVGDQSLVRLRHALWNADHLAVKSSFLDSETGFLSDVACQLAVEVLRSVTGSRQVNAALAVARLWSIIPSHYWANLAPLVLQVLDRNTDRCHQVEFRDLLAVLSSCPNDQHARYLADSLTQKIIVEDAGWKDVDGVEVSAETLQSVSTELAKYLIVHDESLLEVTRSRVYTFLDEPVVGAGEERRSLAWQAYRETVMHSFDVIKSRYGIPVFRRVVQFLQGGETLEGALDIVRELCPVVWAQDQVLLWNGLVDIAVERPWEDYRVTLNCMREFLPCPPEVMPRLIDLLWGSNSLSKDADLELTAEVHSVAMSAVKDAKLTDEQVGLLASSLSELLVSEEPEQCVQAALMVKDYALVLDKPHAEQLVGTYLDALLDFSSGPDLVTTVSELANSFTQVHVYRIQEWLGDALAAGQHEDDSEPRFAAELCQNLLGTTAEPCVTAVVESRVLAEFAESLEDEAWVQMATTLIRQTKRKLSREALRSFSDSLLEVLSENEVEVLRGLLAIADTLDPELASSVAQRVLEAEPAEEILARMEFLRSIRHHFSGEVPSLYLSFLISALGSHETEVLEDITTGFKWLDVSSLSRIFMAILEREDAGLDDNLESIQNLVLTFLQGASDVQALTNLIVSVGQNDSRTAEWLVPQILGALRPDTRAIVIRGTVGMLAYQERPELVSRLWAKLGSLPWIAEVPVADICAVLDHLTLRGDEYLKEGLAVLSKVEIPSDERKRVVDSLYRALRHSGRLRRRVMSTAMDLGLLDYAMPRWRRSGLSPQEETALEAVADKKRVKTHARRLTAGR